MKVEPDTRDQDIDKCEAPQCTDAGTRHLCFHHFCEEHRARVIYELHKGNIVHPFEHVSKYAHQ